MDNNKLAEIRNNAATLPELKSRLKKLNNRVQDSEYAVEALLSKLNKETYDVERLKKDSLSATLLKFIGQYEGRLDKEMQEALGAKINYDKAVNTVRVLKSEQQELLGKINMLEKDRLLYQEELEKRERILMNNMNDEATIEYRRLEAEQEQLAKQLVETKEASRAANKVMDTASTAKQHLEGAESWATFDVWTRGGIFSHMAKYDNIDNAQSEFNTLAIQLEELQKELSDVNLFENLEITEIDDTTRAIDFWFDNIFTDLNVREKIREDMDQLDRLSFKLNAIIKKLENNNFEIKTKLNEIEEKKKDLLIFTS